METSSSDDDWCEDGMDEDDMGLIAEPDEPVPLMSRLVQMALRFTMICVGYGVLNPEHLVGRLPREHWKLLRTSDLYRDMTEAWPTYSPELRNEMYIANFRVDETTFERIFLEVEVCLAIVLYWDHMPALIVSEHTACLQGDITLNPLRRADATPAKKRLAITLYFLSQGDHYLSVANQFGIHKSSVSKHLHAVIPVIEQRLFSRCIRFPAETELLQVIADFEDLIGLPQCAGAIDGCFIPMEVPTGVFSDKYWCYKNIYAIILLAVVDARGIFTSVTVGQPGSVGDGATFNRSKLKRKLESGQLLPHRGFTRRFRYLAGQLLLWHSRFPPSL